MLEKRAFIQGLFLFEGAGLDKPVAFPVRAVYQAPDDKRAQSVYPRAGIPSDELIFPVLTADKKAMQYFPVSAKGAIHAPLAVVENISPGTRSSVPIDAGFVEIN